MIKWALNTNLSSVVISIFIIRWLLGSILLNDGEWDVMQTILTTPLTILTAVVIISTFYYKNDDASKIARKGGIAILFLINWSSFFSAIRRAEITMENMSRVFIYLLTIACVTYYLDTH